MKIYKIIKLILFVISGILVIVFNNYFLENLERLYLLVGGIMAFYGAESCIILSIEKEYKEETLLYMNSIVTFFLGVHVMFLQQNSVNIVVLSVLWSVWAIMRESQEIYEKVLKHWDTKDVSFLNMAESLAVIVYSVLLLFNPTEHHLHAHLILLGVELILEETFPLLAYLELKFKK